MMTRGPMISWLVGLLVCAACDSRVGKGLDSLCVPIDAQSDPKRGYYIETNDDLSELPSEWALQASAIKKIEEHLGHSPQMLLATQGKVVVDVSFTKGSVRLAATSSRKPGEACFAVVVRGDRPFKFVGTGE